MKTQEEKVFVIINSYRVGDILLTNPLIQNIKRLYKNSKVVMLTSPALVDIAKYQEGVDDVVVWDRHGIHKGLWNTFKFAWSFPYKKIFASFPIYGMDRPALIGKLIGSKYVLCEKRSLYTSLLRKSKYKIKFENDNMQRFHISLLTGITKEELRDVPVKYHVQNCADEFIPKEDFIVICPTSSRKEKDMPCDSLIATIKKLSNYKVVVLGKGDRADAISEQLKKENLPNLIDLTGQTSIIQMADIMNKSIGVISVDTGTLHLASALQKPTVALFYIKGTERFIPDPKLYKCIVAESKTPEEILVCLEKIMNISK